jgi:hypothetical protein
VILEKAVGEPVIELPPPVKHENPATIASFTRFGVMLAAQLSTPLQRPTVSIGEPV